MTQELLNVVDDDTLAKVDEVSKVAGMMLRHENAMVRAKQANHKDEALNMAVSKAFQEYMDVKRARDIRLDWI